MFINFSINSYYKSANNRSIKNVAKDFALYFDYCGWFMYENGVLKYIIFSEDTYIAENSDQRLAGSFTSPS